MNNSKTIWLMGRPCSGKTTLAKKLCMRPDTIHLDGDTLREGLCSNLGFSVEDRKENLRRVAHVAKLLNEAGHNVICTFITPTLEAQDMVQNIIPNCYLIEILCSLETCEKRDVKGMYKLAREGTIKDFTGIDSPYQPPDDPHAIINTDGVPIEESLSKLKQIILDINEKHLDKSVEAIGC